MLLDALARVPATNSPTGSNTTEPVEVFEVTGILVEPGDVESLAAAIVRLGTDPDRCSRMGAAGQRLMRTDFDKRRQFDAFAQHFTDVTTNGR